MQNPNPITGNTYQVSLAENLFPNWHPLAQHVNTLPKIQLRDFDYGYTEEQILNLAAHLNKQYAETEEFITNTLGEHGYETFENYYTYQTSMLIDFIFHTRSLHHLLTIENL